jgi:hypothetical protein
MKLCIERNIVTETERERERERERELGSLTGRRKNNIL